MRIISLSCLQQLEVINLCGGEKLGYPCDLEIDLDEGRILSLSVSLSEGFSFFCKREEFVIPWCKIECIGEDAILVKIPQNELCTGEKCKRKRRAR